MLMSDTNERLEIHESGYNVAMLGPELSET